MNFLNVAKYTIVLILVFVICGIFSSSCFTENKNSYPEIRQATMVIKIDSSNPTNSKEFTVLDSSGKPAYKLSVYSISLDDKSINSVQLELNGIEEARTQAGTENEPDLLNPDDGGHGAGQRVFLPNQLCVPNKSEQFWGAERTFILRRMKIDVSFSDIVLSQDNESIVSANLSIQVQPNNSTRSRPEDIPFAGPKPCST